MASVTAMMRTKKIMDMTRSLTLSFSPGSARGLVARPIHEVVPPVGPADVQMHQYPGHRELREGIQIRQIYRPDDLDVQNGGERRQERKPEVEDEEEDSRGYDESPLAPHELLERRRPLNADPLVLPRHANPFLAASTPLRFGTILHRNKLVK